MLGWAATSRWVGSMGVGSEVHAAFLGKEHGPTIGNYNAQALQLLNNIERSYIHPQITSPATPNHCTWSRTKLTLECFITFEIHTLI